MDNLRAVIKNLFCYISTNEILEGNVVYDDISEDIFMQLGSGYITRYSNDELSNMYHYMQNEFQWQSRRMGGGHSNVPIQVDNRWNVFYALIAFSGSVLVEENGMPECQYTQLLRWRDMITALEEDLFITSYLAYKDCALARERYNFFWKPVIGHNNKALNHLVANGVAENHFHLKGSAPYFHLSWMRLMNQIDNPKFDRIFEGYEANRLQKNISYSAKYKNDRLCHMWRQAALIRLFLFVHLKGESELPYGNIGDRNIYEILKDAETLKICISDIQNSIEWMHEKYGIWEDSCNKSELDYMICENYLVRRGDDDVNGPLSGERWFMYHMFCKTFLDCNDMKPYINLFYLYLVLKSNIRRELVQTNINVGFDNFLKYQDRKDTFIEDSIYEEVYVRMAVKDTIYNQHIDSLEARIVPKDTVDKIRDTIDKYDRWITKGIDNERMRDELRDKYFYVMHFVKETERVRESERYIDEYRHYELRQKVKSQALAISQLKNGDYEEADRIKGIDACSPEIWCRPEVFAQAFRYLKDYISDDFLKTSGDNRSVALRATYHVGEDFLDVVDGLRAIDEAILFLNLRCGDRLGHALALGVDVEEWYQSKSYRVMINKIRFLDNLSWLYARLRHYNISDCEDVKSYIEKRFDEYFVEVYKNNINSTERYEIVRNAQEYYMKEGLAHGYNYEEVSVGINEYYEAWKLRGDNPRLYKNGYFKIRGELYDSWDNYAINREFPVDHKIRYKPEVAMLYYAYHFNPEVKKVGDEMIEVKIHPGYIKAVKKIQMKMQEDICMLGIGIETNPSSNYLIGTFRRYDKHPIIGWYNYGLTMDQEAVKKCPQLHVSINTDDQGVFSTYIENEYAYLALALEKSKDDQGKPLYNRTMILQWLDNIRKMGLSQSFK